MKWIPIAQEMPEPWNWVILGYENEHESVVYQIGRWEPDTKCFTFWDLAKAGPTEYDAMWHIEPQQVTHWIDIPSNFE